MSCITSAAGDEHAGAEPKRQQVAHGDRALRRLRVVDRAVDAIAGHVQPAGRGRYSFPFNRITVTFVAPTPEDQARFEAICDGPPSIEDRVQRRLASAGCDNDWSTWWLGSRTQWNVTKDFYLGVDVMYANLFSASLPGNNTTQQIAIGGATHVSDVDNWQFRFRVHRDFYP